MATFSTTPSFKAAPVVATKRSLASKLWPFSSRRITHHTFGKLKPWRNGNYLRTRVDFGPLRKKIWLVIRADSHGPSHIQEMLYLQIQKNYDDLMPGILTALFTEYQKVRRVQPSVPWPEVATPADLPGVIPLDAISLEHGPGHPFVFSFQSELDKDHEFHVFFRSGKLESIAFEH